MCVQFPVLVSSDDASDSDPDDEGVGQESIKGSQVQIPPPQSEKAPDQWKR